MDFTCAPRWSFCGTSGAVPDDQSWSSRIRGSDRDRRSADLSTPAGPGCRSRTAECRVLYHERFCQRHPAGDVWQRSFSAQIEDIAMNFSHDLRVNKIAERALAGERLSFADGVALYETSDLPALGKLADTIRRRRHGRTTYFNVNRHLNPPNVCYADCKFCGFFRTPRQPDAYTHNIDDSLKVAAQAVAEGATEWQFTGGLNTKLPFSYFTDLLSSLKRQYPQLHLKAFTMVEFDHFAHFYKMPDEEVIQKLIEAGLDSCPGGGAEIFREPTRS